MDNYSVYIEKGKSPSKPRWTSHQTLKFVQEYVKYGCFYYSNRSDSNMKQYSRKEALTRLAETMNLPGFGPKEAYAKIRNLRSTYSQELKKLSIRNAGLSEAIYESNLIWFKTLHEALKSAGNDIAKDDCYDQESLANDEEYANGESFGCITFKTEICSNEEDEEKNVDEEEPVASKKTRKRKREDSSPDPNFVDADQLSFSENEFDVFGKSIAAQLKNMSLKDALEAEMYIQNYLSNVRLKQFN